MNEEYLWNKTGEDPEIERLENALAVFRYREAIATLPDALPVYKSAPRRRLSLAFAFASCAAIAIVAAVWLQISNYNSNTENTDEIVFVQQSSAPIDNNPIVEPKLPPARNTDSHERPAGTRRQTITRANAPIPRRAKTKDSAPHDGVAALTSEERYAYRQLMLALSISGSKLKIVQDTINGKVAAEDMDDNASKNQR